MELTLDRLVHSVEAARSQPLSQLHEASMTSRHLGELGDQLLDHFVKVCRGSGHSWGEIGANLAISRQAAQKRFAENGSGSAVSGASPVFQREVHDRQDHHGKYRPLWEWLREQRADRVASTFREIERILGFPLPASSRRHQPHWHSYDGSAVARAIMDAGWRAQRVNLGAETLDLVRSKS